MLAIVHSINDVPRNVKLRDTWLEAYLVAFRFAVEDHNLANAKSNNFLTSIKTDNEYSDKDDSHQEWSIRILECE